MGSFTQLDTALESINAALKIYTAKNIHNIRRYPLEYKKRQKEVLHTIGHYKGLTEPLIPYVAKKFIGPLYQARESNDSDSFNRKVSEFLQFMQGAHADTQVLEITQGIQTKTLSPNTIEAHLQIMSAIATEDFKLAAQIKDSMQK